MMNANYKAPLVIVAVIIIGFLAYGALTMKDNRDVSDRVSDAYHALGNGDSPDKAVRQLEDRTPGQKLGDAVKDTGDKIKDNTKSPDSD